MPITVQGADKVDRMLRGAASRAADPRPVLAEIGAELERMVSQSFASQTSPDGTPWTPRATSYRYADGRPARPRTETRPGRPLLSESGETRGSVTLEVTPRGVGISVGGRAAIHQFGTRHVPARPFVPVTRSGRMASGPAGAWWASVPRRLAAFIADGVTR